MTLRRRGRVGGGRRPTVDERGAYNGQAAGPTARLTGVRYPCGARRQVSFAVEELISKGRASAARSAASG